MMTQDSPDVLWLGIVLSYNTCEQVHENAPVIPVVFSHPVAQEPVKGLLASSLEALCPSAPRPAAPCGTQQWSCLQVVNIPGNCMNDRYDWLYTFTYFLGDVLWLPSVVCMLLEAMNPDFEQQ